MLFVRVVALAVVTLLGTGAALASASWASVDPDLAPAWKRKNRTIPSDQPRPLPLEPKIEPKMMHGPPPRTGVRLRLHLPETARPIPA